MRLETVENLTRDRDLAARHISFLTAERDKLKNKSELAADESLRLKEIETRLADVKIYFAQLEPQLQAAIVELSQKIRQMEDKQQSLILFEKYILLKPMRTIAEKLHLNITAAYHAHAEARDTYNTAQGIPLYKDNRGRKRWCDQWNID